MAHISHFSHGFINPLMAFSFAIAGSLLGLFCMVRARQASTPGARVVRLLYATIALGGTGIWMMHFTAMIGFDVAGTEVRYDVAVTALSLVISIASVGFGIYVVGLGAKSLAKVLIGGPLTGLGVVAMHYTGMGAVRVNGDIDYDPILFAASVAVAVVAATVALAFAVWIENRKTIMLASFIMAIAVCGMHYTGMASVSVTLNEAGEGSPVEGVDPILLLIPIMVLATGALIGLIFGLLTDSDSDEPERKPAAPRPRRDARHEQPRRSRFAADHAHDPRLVSGEPARAGGAPAAPGPLPHRAPAPQPQAAPPQPPAPPRAAPPQPPRRDTRDEDTAAIPRIDVSDPPAYGSGADPWAPAADGTLPQRQAPVPQQRRPHDEHDADLPRMTVGSPDDGGGWR